MAMIRRFVADSLLPASARAAYGWHARPGAFERLVPPWQRIEVVSRIGGIDEGGRVVFDLRAGPLKRRWVAAHRDAVPGEQFVDEQLEGPFDSWVHTHRFVPLADESSRLVDEIVYRLPLGRLGDALGGGIARRELERLFRFRHRRTREDLERHARYAERPRLTVAISGAGGLVGEALSAFLATGGHRVLRLVRGPSRSGAGTSGAAGTAGTAGTMRGEVAWDPRRGTIDAAALEGIDALVHLAGENISAGRWTPERKESIRRSRVDGTRLIAETVARLARPPQVVISASAVGWYGLRADDPPRDEEAAPGSGFLAEVCREWEAAMEPARAAGLRVVTPRIGVVLSARGGALAKLLPPFRAGLGGPVGSGRQWMSWIALDDLVGVIHDALFERGWSGPLNAVSPAPVTNGELTRTLARVLRRPGLMPLPAAAVRLIFGEMGEELLLASARIEPRRLVEAGFAFLRPSLEEALRVELGRETAGERS